MPLTPKFRSSSTSRRNPAKRPTSVELEYAAEICAKADSLIDEVMRIQYKKHPELKQRFGVQGVSRCREDLNFHFSTLAEAITVDEPKLWLEYVAWAKVVLVNRGIRRDDLLDTLSIMQDAISAGISLEAAASANSHIQSALDRFDSFSDSPPTFIDRSDPLQEVASSYLQALLSVDRSEARKLIQAALQNGTSVQDIYQYVFDPVQREVGRLWQMNHISVAQEHYCTATTESLMSEIRGESAEIDRGPHFFLGTCAAGVQHSLGIRMLSELLGANAWKVYFTGANTPSASLVDLISRFKVDVLGISAATSMDLPQVRQLITAVRQSSKSETKILIGGRIFNEFPELWKKVGADSYAKDAVAGMKAADKLVS